MSVRLCYSVAFQKDCKCLNSFWVHAVALCRYNVTRIEGTEMLFTFCRWSWDTVYKLASSNVRQYEETSQFDGSTTVAVLAIELKKLMGHGSTPSDPWPMWPIRFSWPIWPMTHRPIPCSAVCTSLYAPDPSIIYRDGAPPWVVAYLYNPSEHTSTSNSSLMGRWTQRNILMAISTTTL